jgi:hypothetical protein
MRPIAVVQESATDDGALARDLGSVVIVEADR